jgi:hypothetical protein
MAEWLREFEEQRAAAIQFSKDYAKVTPDSQAGGVL